MNIPLSAPPGKSIKEVGLPPSTAPASVQAAPQAPKPSAKPAVEQVKREVSKPDLDSNYDASSFFPKDGAPADAPAETTAVKTDVVDSTTEEVEAPSVASNLLKGKTPKTETAPVVKEAAPATVEHPEAKLELDSKSSASAKDAFKTVKTIAADLRKSEAEKSAKIAELEARLKTAPAGMVPAEEANKYQAQIKELSDRLMVLDLQSHPSFKTQFTIPKQERLDAAKELLVMNQQSEIEPKAMLSLSRAEFGKAVSEAASKLTPYDSAEFSAAMREAYKLNQSEQQAAQKAGETLQAINQNNQSKGTQTFEKVWSETIGKASEFSVEFQIPDKATPEQVEKLQAHNDSLKAISTKARQYALQPKSADEVASNAIKAAMFEHQQQHILPAILGDYENKVRELNALKQQLAAIKGKNPNRENLATSSGSTEGGSKRLEDMGHSEAAAKVWGHRS
jgi:hypothetical protein